LEYQQSLQQDGHFLESVIERFLYHTGISLGIETLSTTKTTEEIDNVKSKK
jgi:hypothetical protein